MIRVTCNPRRTSMTILALSFRMYQAVRRNTLRYMMMMDHLRCFVYLFRDSKISMSHYSNELEYG